MRRRVVLLASFLLLSLAVAAARGDTSVAEVTADPAVIRLNGPNAVYSLLVHGKTAAGHAALTKEARGRRVLPGAPEFSLLLTKASGAMPHGGGVRIPRGTPEYETLRAWIAAGTPLGDPAAPRVASLRVEPAERQLA